MKKSASRRSFLQNVALGSLGAAATGEWLGNAVGQEPSEKKHEESAAQEVSATEPPFALRELYAPGHFGNSYEVAGEYEMREHLAEAKFWGFNRYSEWLDPQDYVDPFKPTILLHLSRAVWDRTKRNFMAAQALGMECALGFTPNHVYVDQDLPELAAKKNARIYGQLICPSIPNARAIILKNCENLLADLAAAGVRLRAINTAPYDCGGCACEKCRPWILTFAQLTREIHDLAKRYHPGVELYLTGWWWNAEEHRLFADWADRETPGLFKGLSLYMPYGQTKVSTAPLPKGCQRLAFVHISYADQASPRDVYGYLGPVVAPVRLQQTVRDLAAQGVTGVAAYSEGVCDDLNKALLAGMGSGRFRTSDEVLRTHARRWLTDDAPSAARWAEWLAQWGRPFDADIPRMTQELARLKKTAKENDDWRRRQWELKLDLFREHRNIGVGDIWTPDRLEAVERFWRIREKIYRGLWGLGPVHFGLSRRFGGFIPWYASWMKHTGGLAQPPEKER